MTNLINMGKEKKMQNLKGKNGENVTWVTSAEVTHMNTTAPIRNKPALYLQPITYHISHITDDRM